MTKSKIDLVREKILLLKQSNLDVKDSLDFLHNIAENIPVVIVTCGPSLSQIPQEKLIALGSKCILIAVKQAHEYLNGVEIFHLINQGNLKKYKYRKSTYVISSFNDADPEIFSPVDIYLPLKERNPAKRLAVTLEFEKFLLAKVPQRPWGPGIILESAIYLALHLGSKDIFLVSYDLASPNASNFKHYNKFYESNKSSKNETAEFYLSKIARKVAVITGYSEARIRYEFGLKYNPTGAIDPDENKILIDSSHDLHKWLMSRGIKLRICSNNSFVSNSIPRVDVDEMEKIIVSKNF